MNLLAQILSSKVHPGIFRLLLGIEIERKTEFSIGTVRRPGPDNQIMND